MSDAGGGSSDPSMDDILASIRKIISDDEARAQVAGQRGASTGPATSGSPESSEQRSASATITPIPQAAGADSRAAGAARRDDVLLLTDLVEEPKSPLVTPHPATASQSEPVSHAEPVARPEPASRPEPIFRPAPVSSPRIDPVSAATMPQHSSETSTSAEQSLVGAAVAGAATSAFDRLSQAVHDSVPAPSAADPGPVMASGKTLEDVVKEMLKPMLKEWLDRNLPPMVERFVEREIVRLTRR